jgi:hypothetical protein
MSNNLILLFSKYSDSCQKLFNIIQNSGIDFSFLIPMCVDNAEVRKRIITNKKIVIRHVPCILSILADGGVEKYEDDTAFGLIQEIIQSQRTTTAASTQPVTTISQIPQEEQYQPELPEHEFVERHIKKPEEKVPEEYVPQTMKSRPGYMPENEDFPDDQENAALLVAQKVKNRKPRTVARPKDQEAVDPDPYYNEPIPEPIQDEDSAHDQEKSDRHRNVRTPKRIQQGNSGDYIEDDSLFSGETVDQHRHPKNTVRKTTKKTVQEENNTLAKAKEIARARELEESRDNAPKDRPNYMRRP